MSFHLSTPSVILVDLRFDVTNKGDEVSNHVPLVAGHGPVHGLNLHHSIGLNLGCDILLGRNA